MEHEHTLDGLIDRKIAGHHPDGFQYDPYTERVVSIDDGARIRVFYPSLFSLLPEQGWEHLPGCLCRDCL